MTKIYPIFHERNKLVVDYKDNNGKVLTPDFVTTQNGKIKWIREEIKDGVFGYVSENPERKTASGKEHRLVRKSCGRCGGSGTYWRGTCYGCSGAKTSTITLTSAKSKITRSTPEYQEKMAKKEAAKKAEREAQWAREAQERINGNPAVLALQNAMKQDWFPDKDMNFAGDLVQKFGRWGNLSEKQMACVKKMSKKPAPVVADPRVADLEKVVKLLEPKNQAFAQSMITQSKTRNLSEKQMRWVVKLTIEAQSAEDKRAEELRKKYLNF